MNILKTGILKTIATSEAFVKGMMFDCRTCGQCVLTNTAMVCPMSCPKGLRNGPCGGTIDEKCEVYTDKQCVWVRIYKRSKKRQQGTQVLISFSGRRLTKSTGIPKLASETATWLLLHQMLPTVLYFEKISNKLVSQVLT